MSSTGANGLTAGPNESLAPDSDSDTNNNDNGQTISNNAVVACGATLTAGSEPTDDGDIDPDTNMSVDFGFFIESKLGNFVWFDLNKNGVQDLGEDEVQNVTATLYDAATDTVIATQLTDVNGEYNFCRLTAGDYYIVFTNLPADHVFTEDDGSNDTTNSDADPSNGRTVTYILGAGEEIDTVDGGIVFGATTGTAGELAQTGLDISHVVYSGIVLIALVSTATSISNKQANTDYSRR